MATISFKIFQILIDAIEIFNSNILNLTNTVSTFNSDVVISNTYGNYGITIEYGAGSGYVLTSDATGLASWRIGFSGGTVGAPSIYFTSDPNTGLYSIAADNMGITCGGVKQVDISTTSASFTNPVLASAGAVGAPSISFTGDTNTGLYNIGADNIGITANGIKQVDISTTSASFTNPMIIPAGAVGAPSISFTGDTNTGLYNIGADNIGITANGVKQVDISTTSASFTNPVFVPVGAVGAPSISFTADPNTGVYNIGADNIGIACGGTKIIDTSTTVMAVTGEITTSNQPMFLVVAGTTGTASPTIGQFYTLIEYSSTTTNDYWLTPSIINTAAYTWVPSTGMLTILSTGLYAVSLNLYFNPFATTTIQYRMIVVLNRSGTYTILGDRNLVFDTGSLTTSTILISKTVQLTANDIIFARYAMSGTGTSPNPALSPSTSVGTIDSPSTASYFSVLRIC